MLTIYGIFLLAGSVYGGKTVNSEDKIDRYICSGDRSAAILDFHCICRFMSYSLQRW